MPLDRTVSMKQVEGLVMQLNVVKRRLERVEISPLSHLDARELVKSVFDIEAVIQQLPQLTVGTNPA